MLDRRVPGSVWLSSVSFQKGQRLNDSLLDRTTVGSGGASAAWEAGDPLYFMVSGEGRKKES